MIIKNNKLALKVMLDLQREFFFWKELQQRAETMLNLDNHLSMGDGLSVKSFLLLI